jgi:hypothetical protein
MILEFQTLQKAQDFMDALALLVIPSGYTIWDHIKSSPDDTFYIGSPTGDPRYPDWQTQLTAEDYEYSC